MRLGVRDKVRVGVCVGVSNMNSAQECLRSFSSGGFISLPIADIANGRGLPPSAMTAIMSNLWLRYLNLINEQIGEERALRSLSEDPAGETHGEFRDPMDFLEKD